MDDIIQMSNGLADEPEGAAAVVMASGTQMPAPPAKSINGMSTMTQHRPSPVGVTNAASVDDRFDGEIISGCSTNLIDSIKSYEGFVPTSKWDYSQYSVGYGLYTDKIETITEEEASRRLTIRVAEERNYVSEFSKRHGYNWTDCQIDALTSFRYNTGSEGFNDLTANGTRSNEVIAQKMLEYNKVKSNGTYKISSGLVARRNSESSWFTSGALSSSSEESGNSDNSVEV